MNRLKMFFQESMMISTGILFMIGIEGLLYYFKGEADNFRLPWHIPLSILLCGLLCAIASQILPFDRNISKVEWNIRLFIHLILLLIIVSVLGYVARWYSDFENYMYIFVSFLIVYIFVWCGMLWIWKRDEIQINKSLSEMHDEE